MTKNDAVIAIFADHRGAEAAIRKLAASGLDMKHFRIVGKGYHTEEKVVGFYNTGDRVRFWAEMAQCGAVSGAYSSAGSC